MTREEFDPNDDPSIITLEKQGAAAKAEGLGPEACPFDEGNQAWDEWMAGYNGSES
jgi:hypothetical protein